MTMHTFLYNEADDNFSIGMWLPNREGITAFVTLFKVHTRYDAFTAVNMLNGGVLEGTVEIVPDSGLGAQDKGRFVR